LSLGLNVRRTADGVRFAVHVQPRASRTGIAGVHGDALKIAVSAPPADGAANEAVIELLARSLSLPQRSVRLISGATSRRKIIEVDGASVSDVERLIEHGG
jgi:uncharacterized protein